MKGQRPSPGESIYALACMRGFRSFIWLVYLGINWCSLRVPRVERQDCNAYRQLLVNYSWDSGFLVEMAIFGTQICSERAQIRVSHGCAFIFR